MSKMSQLHAEIHEREEMAGFPDDTDAESPPDRKTYSKCIHDNMVEGFYVEYRFADTEELVVIEDRKYVAEYERQLSRNGYRMA